MRFKFLHNEIAFALDSLLKTQPHSTDHTASDFSPVKFEVGDLVLVSTTQHLNLSSCPKVKVHWTTEKFVGQGGEHCCD
jgi:hypothetical protein